jgi:steroid 5-alpha reductase family enzyme
MRLTLSVVVFVIAVVATLGCVVFVLAMVDDPYNDIEKAWTAALALVTAIIAIAGWVGFGVLERRRR